MCSPGVPSGTGRKAVGEQRSERTSVRERRAQPTNNANGRDQGAGLDLGVALARIALEPGLALAEPELDVAGGAVAVLGELEVDDLAVEVARLLARPLLLLAVEEEHEVRVLLDGARLAQVRQSRLLRLAHLRLA